MNVDELRLKLTKKQKPYFNDVNLENLEDIIQINIIRKTEKN